MNNLKHLIKYVHGESATTINYASVHVLPIVIATIYRLYRIEYFANSTVLQLFFYYIFMWELLGGIFAIISKSTKKFWLQQPLKYKLNYVLLHGWQPIIWFTVLKVDIRFCAVYFLYLAFSTIALLKITIKLQYMLSILFTFGGVILCYYMENHYSPFPFGYEWIPYLLYIKLIFAFTVNLKIQND